MQPLLFITAFKSLIFLLLPTKNSIQYIKPVHFLKIHFDIIHTSKRRFPQWSLSLTIPKPKPANTYTHSHTRYLKRPVFYFYFITRKMNEEYISLSSSIYSFLHSPVTPFLLDPNILLSLLFTNTLSLRSSLKVIDYLVIYVFIFLK